jgi:hypothetical protein
MNHYDYLTMEFVPFYRRVCEAMGVAYSASVNEGLIVAHGDKCYSARRDWEAAGLPFEKGVAIYLLTYVHPWSTEVRETDHGWVNPHAWIAQNAYRFLPFFSA